MTASETFRSKYSEPVESVSKVIRDLIPPQILINLIRANESALKHDPGAPDNVSRSTGTVGKNNSVANN